MSQVFLRPPFVLVEVSDAKVGLVCASSSSQVKQSPERAQLKLRAGAKSSLVLQAVRYLAKCEPQMGNEIGYSTLSSGQV